jgi:hypothetical protein
VVWPGGGVVGKYGEGIMRNLWELVINTVVLNDLQAEFGTAPGTEESEGKMQHSCFS